MAEVRMPRIEPGASQKANERTKPISTPKSSRHSNTPTPASSVREDQRAGALTSSRPTWTVADAASIRSRGDLSRRIWLRLGMARIHQKRREAPRQAGDRPIRHCPCRPETHAGPLPYPQSRNRIRAVNVQLNTVSDTRKSLVITLDKDEVDAEHQAVLGEYVRLARLPGFRPGKAPAPLVVKRFAKEIADEFKQKLVTKAYRDALEKEKLAVLSVVSVEEGTIERGAPAAITVTVDVRPDFTLPDYVGLPTQVPSVEPTFDEIDGVIQALRSEGADFKPAERPARKGDYIKLAYRSE